MAKKSDKKEDLKEDVQEDMPDQEEAPVQAKSKITHTEHPIIDKAMKPFEGCKASDFDLFEIEIPHKMELYINGEKLEKKLIMPRHLYVSIVPMIEARLKQEESVSTGRNYLTRKLPDGKLVVTQSKLKD